MTRLRVSGGGGTAEWQRSSRWSPATAAAALGALKESGESVAAFAARHGVDAHRLYDWRRRLRDGGEPSRTSFVEIVARAAAPVPCVFEVAMPGGEVVRVPSCFDDDSLHRLLAIVRRGC